MPVVERAIRKPYRRSGRLLPVARGWRGPAARFHYSPDHHDTGVHQSQELLGIRQPEPARRMERLGHVRDLAGGTDAEHRAETNDHQITKRPLPCDICPCNDRFGSFAPDRYTTGGRSMSAFSPKADIERTSQDVRFVPLADKSASTSSPARFKTVRNSRCAAPRSISCGCRAAGRYREQ